MLHRDTLFVLCRARDLLRDTDGPPVSIREVAREVGISLYHFIRLYKAVFGETPKQCQLHARLEKARRLLLLTDAPVTEVCLEAGFNSLGTFSHYFAQRVGMTPTSYRKKYRVMINEPGEIPPQLVPGCFSLMYGANR